MHPDVGAVIGISLAGSVLLVAVIFFCILHLPCCSNVVKPSRNRNISRPSTSSRGALTRREIPTLSAMDLHHQNTQHFYSGAGIVNPVWQLHCSCGVLTATSTNNQTNSQYSVQPSNSCHCCHSSRTTGVASHSPSECSTSSFQYHTPQLFTSESPPPYPGFVHMNTGAMDSISVNSTTNSNPPPPYSSPKH